MEVVAGKSAAAGQGSSRIANLDEEQHQAGKSQCTVPASCACAAFHDSAGLKGMCGAVWWMTVNVDIQKW